MKYESQTNAVSSLTTVKQEWLRQGKSKTFSGNLRCDDLHVYHAGNGLAPAYPLCGADVLLPDAGDDADANGPYDDVSGP